MKQFRKIFWIIFSLLLPLILGACAGNTSNIELDESIKSAYSTKSSNSTRNSNIDVETNLEIHFIDVGQGDSTLIICDGEAMLIDAGDNNQGTKIQSYLQYKDVESLKYIIGTHPDEDHIGGMDVILYKFDCETVIMPEKEKDTATFRDVIDTMKAKNYKNTLPIVGTTYDLGEAQFTILAPNNTYTNTNDNSVAILLQYGENKFLFTGDAEEAAEADILDNGISIEADVYHVGHHGSKTASSESFLEKASPAYAVISCGEGNSYGHPHSQTLNTLRTDKVKVFRTDEQGTIVASSDGKEITWNCSPIDTWQAGEQTGSSAKHSKLNEELPGNGETENISNAETDAQENINEVAKNDETTSYICNKNTKTFHYPDCSSANKMKESNKLEITETREELIEQGYKSCGNCNP